MFYYDSKFSEDHSRNEFIEEQMEVNEVVEDASIVKELVETKEQEDDETVKEIADEVNYEDEEMPDTTRVFCSCFVLSIGSFCV